MSKETCDFSKQELIDWMIKNNPDVVFEEGSETYRFLQSVRPINELIFPDGWYLNEKNGLTNKHNSTTGLYVCVDIYVIA